MKYLKLANIKDTYVVEMLLHVFLTLLMLLLLFVWSSLPLVMTTKVRWKSTSHRQVGGVGTHESQTGWWGGDI